MVSLDKKLFLTLDKLNLSHLEDKNLFNYLVKLKSFDEYKWKHSVEVGLTCSNVIDYAFSNVYDKKDFVIAGLLHDVGVIEIDKKIVEKTNSPNYEYSHQDHEQMKNHVINSYDLIKEDFYFPGRIILYHHKMSGGYPTDIPPAKEGVVGSIEKSAETLGRILSFIDWENSMERNNSKFTGLSVEKKYEQFMGEFQDYNFLIQNLKRDGVFNKFKGDNFFYTRKDKFFKKFSSLFK